MIVRRSRVDAPSTARAVAELDPYAERLVHAYGGIVAQRLQVESSQLALFETVSQAVRSALSLQLWLTDQGWPARIAMFLSEQSDPDEVTGQVLATAEALRAQAVDGTVIADSGCVTLLADDPEAVGRWRSLGASDSTPHALFVLEHEGLSYTEADHFRTARPENLPRHMTSFVGRESEIEQVLERFYLSRIVSIVGPGGMGKTRLAVQVAHRLSESQPDGTWWVDARNAVGVDSLADRLLQAIPRPMLGESAPLERLQGTLRDRQAVLLIDNAEDAKEIVGELIAGVGQACPNIAFLVTSRQPLDLLGESVFKLGPLSAENELGAAARVFLDRVSLVDPEFEPTPSQTRSIQTICRMVDGIPLAIEIAAALYPGQSIPKIERMVTQSVLELKSRRTGAASLNAVLSWGYDTLKKAEQTVLQAISVFPIRFNLSEAEAVCGSQKRVDEILTRLVAASMIQQDGDDYRWLVPMREFALKRLRQSGQEEAVYDLATRLALDEVESLYERGVEIKIWLDRCERIYPLVMEIVDRLLKKPIRDDLPVRFVYGLYDYWYTRGPYVAGEALGRRLLAKSAERPVIERLRLLNMSGILRMQQGRFRDAAADLSTALELSKSMGSPILESKLMSNYGLALCRIPRLEEASAAADRACEIGEHAGDKGSYAGCVSNSASIWISRKDLGRAALRIDQFRALDVKSLKDQVDLTEATLHLFRGNFRRAQAMLEDILVNFIETQNMRSTLASLNLLVSTLAAQSMWRQAAALSGLADRLSEEFICWQPAHVHEEVAKAMELIRSGLGDEYEAEVAIGRGMSLEELAQFLSRRGTPIVTDEN